MNNNSSSDEVAAAAATVELVSITVPFSGHIVSMVEFAKLLVDRDHRLSITIIIISLPFDPNANAYTHSLPTSLTQPRIRFISLPPLSEDDSNSVFADKSAPASTVDALVTLIGNHKQGVRDAVAKLRAESHTCCSDDDSGRLAGFVVDLLCWPMMDVADDFGVPCYVYYTCSASVLGLTLHLQDLHDEQGQDLTEFKDSDLELAVPSFVNLVPVGKVLPSVMTDKEDSPGSLKQIRKLRRAKAILVNSFAGLEPHAVDSILKGRPPGIPPVYLVGPNLNLTGQRSYEWSEQTIEIVKWLDEQPPLSVVFLCFGSMGSFHAEQVREIACGLECSGYRFLWSLRRPPPKDEIQPVEYKDLEEVLPEGFLKRTAGKGKLIGWAPQAVVLSHPSVGGFVSHCGWNSVLESLWFGVPIATWPLYAEQQLNAFMLLKELGLAAEITMEYKNDLWKLTANMLVRREAVERGIRCVMEQESEVRTRVKAAKEESRKTVMEGGSSYTWLRCFVEDVVSSMPSRF